MIDTDKVSGILVECAERFILPRYRQLAAHEISTKTGPMDLVTHADLEVEEHLKKVLPALLPGSVFIGEEGVSSGGASLDTLKDKTQKVWVADPVDGTRNFVEQRREFGVMLALAQGGEITHAWIYDILGKSMITAEKGAGALVDGLRVHIHAIDKEPAEMNGFMNPHYFPKELRPKAKEAAKHFNSWKSLNCAAHEYLGLLQGRADFAIYSRSKPWDHLPGTLIVQEAGGYVAKLDGSPYTPQDDRVALIAATSEANWHAVLKVFKAFAD
jgi:fructose-1,6-bisphosphatase/inositol monophosphatase family enzyme